MNKIAFSVDIEDWYHNPAVVGSSFSKYKTIEDFVKEQSYDYKKFLKPFDITIQLLNNFGIKATFFIVGEMAQRFPYIVEQIVLNGHEVACHGHYHYMKYDPKINRMLYSKNQFENMTGESKYILESLCGEKVIGYRAPCAYICGDMIDSLEKIGFKYDSSVSVNSIYNKSDRKTDGVTTTPYFPDKGSLANNGEKRDIIEFPWPYYDFCGFKFPTAGGPFLRFFGEKYISMGIKQSLKRGDTALYFHVIDISEESFPPLGKNRPFYFVFKGQVVKRRLNALLEKFNGQFCPFIEILPKYINI